MFVKKALTVVFSVLAYLSFLPSCQKVDTTDLGVGLIPTVDNINTFDTSLEITTSNFFLDDSSNVGRTQEHAVGIIEDPAFGRTVASIYFEILPSVSGTSPFVNKDSIRGIDSVVLTLDYSGLYGDSSSIENINVYEIAQSAKLEDAAVKVTSPEYPVVPGLLGGLAVNFTTLNDPKQYKLQGKDTAVTTDPNVLRIRLDQSLGTRLSRYDTTNAYKSDSLFRTFFKGLAIRADVTGSPVKRALAYFKISDNSKTRLTVYHRITRNGVADTVSSNFLYRATGSTKNLGFVANYSANLVQRTITGSNYASNIANGNNNPQNLYIQSGPGSYALLHIPGLSNLSNRIIHKADLLIERLASADDNYFTPPILFLDVNDTVKKRITTVTNDFNTDFQGQYNIGDFGGIIEKDQYSFNLSRHIQGLVTRKEPVYKYRLYAPFETWPVYLPDVQGRGIPLTVNQKIAAGRVVLAGGSHPTKKMRLRIIYSRI